MNASAWTQVGQLARRSVVRSLRQPALLVPAIVFPLFVFALTTSGLDRATLLPGFPTDSYITFTLAVPFIQGALFALMNSGLSLSIDIQTGFFNRLSLTPLRSAALLAGLLAGAVALGLIQATIFLAVGLAAGADFAAGPGGVPVLFALSVLITVGFGALGLFMTLRGGGPEGGPGGRVIQTLFPLMFILIFFSSVLLPRDLIQEDWFRQIVTLNPVSYLVEGLRSLMMIGWDAEALALGFGFAAAIAGLAIMAASSALRTRMART